MCSNLFLILRIIFGLSFAKTKKGFMVVYKVLQVKSLELDGCLMVDSISLLFSCILCIIVSCVLKFSCVYMERDTFNIRFTWLVLRFVLSMLCLIFIPHFFFLLIGWDGLGITSFILVIYYLRDSSWAAGMKTYLINRIGDRFFIIGLILFISKGCWEIKRVKNKDILILMIVIGCFTKSAQFPFSRWLPAAMAAPTPVSSLVHSSTLVTAGIYLLIRFRHMLPKWGYRIIGICGMWTLYSARLAACCEYDGKKVVAYSTLRQLGLMAVAISLRLPMIAFYHLITHAMFKALIFICVGYLIKKRGHFQDLRRLKGLWRKNPVLATTLLVSKASLAGFPFLAGYFSKELIIENNILIIKWIFHVLLLFSLPLTSYYRCRLCFNILNGVKYKTATTPYSERNVLLFSILPLYLGSIFVGRVLYTNFYSLRSIYPCHSMKIFVFLSIALGVLLSWHDVKIKNNSLIVFFRSICYLTPFKGSFWKKNYSVKGKDLFCILDQGALSSTIWSLDGFVKKAGENLHQSVNYFLSPRRGYYIFSIAGLALLVGITS